MLETRYKWDFGHLPTQRKLLKIWFNGEIYYSKENNGYRTFSFNPFLGFSLRREGFKAKNPDLKRIKSGFVPEVGIEPTLQRNTSLSRARLPVPPLRLLPIW